MNLYNATDNHKKLIEEINLLGPWVHGTFDLGNGLIIEDSDELHKRRIVALKEIFAQIILEQFGMSNLSDRTFCDVGCNTGFFLHSLGNKFNFKKCIGIEPRFKNLQKANFIKSYYKISDEKWNLVTHDILGNSDRLPTADIVLMAGVMHHLNDHMLALRNLYSMTKEICIIETCALNDQCITAEIKKQLFLGESIYGSNKNSDQIGITGYKYESNHLDGATLKTGLVGIPSQWTLVKMMEAVGFKDVRVVQSPHQLKESVFSTSTYRDYVSVVVSGRKTSEASQLDLDQLDDIVEKQKFETAVPWEIIEPLYLAINGHISKNELDSIPKLVLLAATTKIEEERNRANKELDSLLVNLPFRSILSTFRFAPLHKINFEYAKTSYFLEKFDLAIQIIQNLHQTPNLDWRVVYMSYYLKAKINYQTHLYKDALEDVNKSLRAHPEFLIAQQLKEEIVRKF